MTAKEETTMLEALNNANATTYQKKAALTLLKIDGLENTLKYVQRVARRNAKGKQSENNTRTF